MMTMQEKREQGVEVKGKNFVIAYMNRKGSQVNRKALTVLFAWGFLSLSIIQKTCIRIGQVVYI